MSDDEIVEQIIHSLTNYNLRDIKKINEQKDEFTIAEFILCSCLIDQISGFRYNTKHVGERYKQFVEDYLPDYKPRGLYIDLRNRLVHNYSLGIQYGLIRKRPDLHLEIDGGKILLNLENFISDLERALQKYFSELRIEGTIRQNAIKWHKKFKIIGLVNPPFNSSQGQPATDYC